MMFSSLSTHKTVPCNPLSPLLNKKPFTPKPRFLHQPTSDQILFKINSDHNN